MAESPNLLRDIALAKRYLNGEGMNTLSDEMGFSSPSRMPKVITYAALRARTNAMTQGIQDPELNLMLGPPTQLRKNAEYVIKILDMHEKEIQREKGPVELDDPLIRLHLPARTHNVIKGKFATVCDLIVHLNANEGKLRASGTSDYALSVILQSLEENNLAKWLTFRTAPILPDVLRQVLEFMDNPYSFSAKEKARLQEDVAKKLEVYKNFRR